LTLPAECRRLRVVAFVDRDDSTEKAAIIGGGLGARRVSGRLASASVRMGRRGLRVARFVLRLLRGSVLVGIGARRGAVGGCCVCVRWARLVVEDSGAEAPRGHIHCQFCLGEERKRWRSPVAAEDTRRARSGKFVFAIAGNGERRPDDRRPLRPIQVNRDAI
jgi:hypothetical protein